MSELLLRGWNVAVPVVDVGDDMFVIDDRDKTTYRVQVKSSRIEDDSARAVSFNLSRRQLSSPQEIELFYMLLVRTSRTWRSFVVSRTRLDDIHKSYLSRPASGAGRPPKAHKDAIRDGITLKLAWGEDEDPRGWGVSFAEFEAWPEELPELSDGPGTVIKR